MTDERVKALNDLGIVWERGRDRKGGDVLDRDTTKIDERWNRYLEGELLCALIFYNLNCLISLSSW